MGGKYVVGGFVGGCVVGGGGLVVGGLKKFNIKSFFKIIQTMKILFDWHLFSFKTIDIVKIHNSLCCRWRRGFSCSGWKICCWRFRWWWSSF